MNIKTTVASAVIAMFLLLFVPSLAMADGPAIKIIKGKQALEITIDGKPFTTYHFVPTADDPEFHRPYFFPVFSADGVQQTADRDRETIGQANREHPWHRSVWVGMGDVNGVDHWTHPATGKKLQQHVKFEKITSDGFVETLTWDGNEPGKPVLSEVRTVRIVAYADGARGIDLTTKITAASGDAVFKVKPLTVSGVEGGWLAARVPMEVSTNRASVISSSAGATNEAESRSKPANWCDYSGTIGGKMFGIAEFDHPSNAGHPTPFAVRQFGLLTQIGVHNWTLKSGESETIRHMVLFHAGDAKSAKLDERFEEFAKVKNP